MSGLITRSGRAPRGSLHKTERGELQVVDFWGLLRTKPPTPEDQAQMKSRPSDTGCGATLPNIAVTHAEMIRMRLLFRLAVAARPLAMGGPN